MSCYKYSGNYIKASSKKQFKHFGFLCQLKVHDNYLSASEELSQKNLKIVECSKEELVFME
jgi:hypothetical protein